MFTNPAKNRLLPLISVALFAGSASLASAATALPGEMRGQWSGGTLLEGQRETAKTMLDLYGDGDSALRIESRMTCTFGGGSYAPDEGGEAGAWSLTFKSARGGEACERMAQGKLIVRAGNKPRTLAFDLVYPGRDGASNHRHGLLSHYP